MANLSIEGAGSRLRVRVEAPSDVLRIVLTVAGSGIFVFLFTRKSGPMGWLALVFAVVFVISAIREIFGAIRGTDVELLVEDLNFSTSGHAPGGYHPGFVSRDDLLRLEFRNGSEGGDSPECPRGLYVEYNSQSAFETSICVLPHIDEQQAQEAIQAIRFRFPELDRLTPRPQRGGLISLNLS